MFEVSDKIVCINDRGLKEFAFLFTDIPVYGRVYVVRGMDYSPETLEPDDIPGVLLVGIFGCDLEDTGIEHSFHAKRFVPLDEYKKIIRKNKTLKCEEPIPEECLVKN